MVLPQVRARISLTWEPTVGVHPCACPRGRSDTLPCALQNLPSRPRRNRRSETFRSAMRESFLHPSNFIMPIFVHEEGSQNQPIPSMPGYYRLAYGKNVIDNVAEARSYGINQVVIFPKVRGSFPVLALCRQSKPLLCCQGPTLMWPVLCRADS